MIHSHKIAIPPSLATAPIVMVFRVTLDHGVEQIVQLELEPTPDEPDHVTGTITLGTDTRVQDVVREG